MDFTLKYLKAYNCLFVIIFVTVLEALPLNSCDNTIVLFFSLEAVNAVPIPTISAVSVKV